MSDVKLPPKVVLGNVLKPRNTALTFSSDFSNLIEGREPKNSSEICISSSLVNKLGKSDTLYCAGMVESSISGDYLDRDYRIGELKVVGVVENDLDVLYGNEYWCIDYWRDVLGMSSFLLGPSKAVYRLKEGYDGGEVTKILGAQYPDYRFVDPTENVKDSVSSVTSYVKLALQIASIVTLVTAGFLLLVVALLTGLENKHEGKLLHTLGIKREEIFESYGASLLIVTIYSIISAVIALFTLEVAVDSAIKESFSSNATFYPDFIPPLVTVAIGLLGLVAALIFIRLWVKRRNFLREEEKS
jgi:ABC-type antimicrobial peptide transport system permease subunit